jgi:hypothetical protein
MTRQTNVVRNHLYYKFPNRLSRFLLRTLGQRMRIQDNTNTERNIDIGPHFMHGSKPRLNVRGTESNAHLRLHGHCEWEVIKINHNMI